MKRFLFLLIFIPGILLAQKNEGEVQYEIKTAVTGKAPSWKYFRVIFKNGNYKTIQADSTSKVIEEYIGNRKDSLLYRVSHSTKTVLYQKMPVTNKSSKDTNSIAEKTGRDSIILGFKCVEYKVTSKRGFNSVWVTEEPEAESFELFYPGIKGTPLYMQMVAFDVDVTLSVTRYIKRKVKNKEMALPKNYKVEEKKHL